MPAWVTCAGLRRPDRLRRDGDDAARRPRARRLARPRLRRRAPWSSTSPLDAGAGAATARRRRASRSDDMRDDSVDGRVAERDRRPAPERTSDVAVGRRSSDGRGSPTAAASGSAFLDYVDWDDGRAEHAARSASAMNARRDLRPHLGRRRSRSSANCSFGQLLLVLLAVVGVLFLIIQAVAFVMGLALARSITGACTSCSPAPSACAAATSAHKIRCARAISSASWRSRSTR